MVKRRIVAELKAADVVAIGTDCWSSAATQGYVGVTVHWITEKFEARCRCLAVRHHVGSQNAENLSAVVLTVIDEFELRRKVIAIVTDNVAVNAAMVGCPCSCAGGRAARAHVCTRTPGTMVALTGTSAYDRCVI